MNQKLQSRFIEFQKKYTSQKNQNISFEPISFENSFSLFHKKNAIVTSTDFSKYVQQLHEIQNAYHFLEEYICVCEDFIQSLNEELIQIHETNQYLKICLQKEKEIKNTLSIQMESLQSSLAQSEHERSSLQSQIKQLTHEIRFLRKDKKNLMNASIPNLSNDPKDYQNDTRILTTTNPRNKEIQKYTTMYTNREPSKNQKKIFFDIPKKINEPSNSLTSENLNRAPNKKNSHSSSQLPWIQKTVFCWIETHTTNVFYHSIREMVLMDSSGKIIFNHTFVQQTANEEVYDFESYREKIEKLLNTYSVFVSFQTPIVLKYLFGNFVACPHLIYHDVLSIYQYVSKDSFSQDILLCAQSYDFDTNIFDRNILNKTQTLRKLYFQLFQTFEDSALFEQVAKIESFETLVNQWNSSLFEK